MHLKFSRHRRLHCDLSPTMVQTLQTKILFYFQGNRKIIYSSLVGVHTTASFTGTSIAKI